MESGPPISLPPQLRALNALLPLAKRLGILEPHDDPEWYMERARRRTGLDDFGDYDLATPLEKLLHTLKHETDLSFFGRIGIYTMVLRNLENNLLATKALSDNPDIREVDVDSPIVIVCTPRTGSTLLHKLLACHEDVRSPRMWELHRPAPPPHPDAELTDPRIRASDREFGMYYRLVPEMKAIHFFDPMAIEECTHLFGNNFTCRLSFTTMANVNSYTRWVMEHDMAGAYRDYRRSLQILKYHYPGKRMVLKSPAHILCLEALAEVFPRAQIVHLHRDPVSAAGSFCSLTEAVQITLRERVDVGAIGDTWKAIWTPALMNADAIEKGSGMDVLHLNYRDLIADPAGATRGVFEHFGWRMPDSLGSRIEEHLAQNPKAKYGKHAYDIRRYGIDPAVLYGQTAEYIERHRVPLER